MFSTMPSMGTLSFRNIARPLRTSSSATSCGVVTITTPHERDHLRQRELGVAGARRHVEHQVVERAPGHVAQELLDGGVDHRAAPHERLALVDEQPDRHDLHAVGLDRDDAGSRTSRACPRAPIISGTSGPYTSTSTRPTAAPAVTERERQVHGHRRLADAALARRHRDGVLDLGDELRRPARGARRAPPCAWPCRLPGARGDGRARCPSSRSTRLTPGTCSTTLEAPLWSSTLVAGDWPVKASVNDTLDSSDGQVRHEAERDDVLAPLGILHRAQGPEHRRLGHRRPAGGSHGVDTRPRAGSGRIVSGSRTRTSRSSIGAEARGSVKATGSGASKPAKKLKNRRDLLKKQRALPRRLPAPPRHFASGVTVVTTRDRRAARPASPPAPSPPCPSTRP